MTNNEAIHGAVYIPARAFNAWQMWADFDTAEIERDLGFARSVNLNALRVWFSYERCREDPDKTWRDFTVFLDLASSKGIRVLVSFFEDCGRPFLPPRTRATAIPRPRSRSSLPGLP